VLGGAQDGHQVGIRRRLGDGRQGGLLGQGGVDVAAHRLRRRADPLQDARNERVVLLEQDGQQVLRGRLGVLAARGKRYVMANVPRTQLEEVKRVVPGLNGPTIIDIMNGGHYVAVHAVVSAATIYRTIADLKALGAEGILVTRIERLMS